LNVVGANERLITFGATSQKYADGNEIIHNSCTIATVEFYSIVSLTTSTVQDAVEIYTDETPHSKIFTYVENIELKKNIDFETFNRLAKNG